MSVREWLMEDKKLTQLLSTVCKFDYVINDHTNQKQALTHIVLVQRMEATEKGWQRMPRECDVTNSTHDDAWVCKYHPKGRFCKNQLYLGNDGELHLSRVATGMHYENSEKNQCENPLVQTDSWTEKREVNVVLSLVEARELLKEFQK